MTTNENIQSHQEVKIGSERSFGLVFAAVFVVIGLFPLIRADMPRWWSLGVAAAFAACAFLAPAFLRPLNRVWFKFGLALHHVVNPVIMGLMFYGAVLPTGLVLRAMGKDLLRLKRDPAAATYWIEREQPAPTPGSMAKQF